MACHHRCSPSLGVLARTCAVCLNAYLVFCFFVFHSRVRGVVPSFSFSSAFFVSFAFLSNASCSKPHACLVSCSLSLRVPGSPHVYTFLFLFLAPFKGVVILRIQNVRDLAPRKRMGARVVSPRAHLDIACPQCCDGVGDDWESQFRFARGTKAHQLGHL